MRRLPRARKIGSTAAHLPRCARGTSRRTNASSQARRRLLQKQGDLGPSIQVVLPVPNNLCKRNGAGTQASRDGLKNVKGPPRFPTLDTGNLVETVDDAAATLGIFAEHLRDTIHWPGHRS